MVELPLPQIADRFEHGVKVKAHSYRMKQYPNTFVGVEAVDFLVQSRLADSRTAALRIGKALVDRYGLFVKVTGDVEFADDQFLFQFTPKDQRKEIPPQDSTSMLDGSIQRLSFSQHDSSESDVLEDARRAEIVFEPETPAKIRLSEVADLFLSGVKVKSNRYRGRGYPRTFVGSEAVTFLVNSSCAPSRKAAVEVCLLSYWIQTVIFLYLS